MLKNKLLGMLTLIVGIFLVFALSGCSVDKLFGGLGDNKSEGDVYMKDYPNDYNPSGYPNGTNDDPDDPTGTWDFSMNGQSATITINNYSWTLNSAGMSDSGSFSLSGKVGTLYSSTLYKDIGTTGMTSSTTMTLTLISPPEMVGIYYATRGW